MHWGDVPAWVALFVATSAAFVSWRILRWEKQSSQAAIRSADEAARANLIAERALERGHAERITPANEPARPNVSWRIENRDGDRYVLRNTGTDTAEHVYVDDSQAPRINRRLPNDSIVRPGEGHDMLLKGSWQQPMPNQLYLRWAGQDDWVAVPLP
jgi:hypothetical protein